MRTCLPATDHVIAAVEVADLYSDPRRTAEVLLRALGLRSGGLPDERDVDSSNGTWIAQLVRLTIERAALGHPDKIVWIVIDKLGELPEGGGRDLLSELYRQVADTTNIRVVLLELPAPPDGFPDHLLVEEDIVAPDVEDIRRYVRRRLVADGHVFTGDGVDRFADLIHRTVGLEIQELAQYIRRTVDPLLDEWEEG